MTHAQPGPSTTVDDQPRRDTGGVSGFLREAWQNYNPMEGLKAIYEHGSIEVAKSIPRSSAHVFEKGMEAYKQGRYVEALRHTVNWLIPIIGPGTDRAGDLMDEGRYSEGTGATFGIGLGVVSPTAVARLKPSFRTPRLPSRLNPVEAGAVQFGRDRGIPLDAGTATGNRLVRDVQSVVQNQPGGAGFAQRARQSQSDAIARVGSDLAGEIQPRNRASGPVRSMSPEDAGATARSRIQDNVADYHGQADEAYAQFREIESQNVQSVVNRYRDADGNYIEIPENVALPVDMRAAKAALQPIYERMTRQMPLTQRQASPAMQALQNIIDGPDYVSASIVDTDLGTLKSITRQADSQFTRTLGEGIVANAINELDSAVMLAARRAGPDAVDALEQGRNATRLKYRSAAVLDQLRDEPVQLFDQLTGNRDRGIELVREVAREAPESMPEIGRSFLEGLLDTATREGGFGKAGTVMNRWDSMGLNTKMELFGNRKLVSDLDNFFLLAKRASENPNPSRSGYIASLTGTGLLLATRPLVGGSYIITNAALSRLMFDPRFVQLATEGLRVPVGNAAAASLVSSQLLSIAGDSAEQISQPVGRLPLATRQ